MRYVEAVERGISVVGYRHRRDGLGDLSLGCFAFFGGVETPPKRVAKQG